MKKELEILKTAIINEMEGRHFYQLAAEKAGDPVVKESFAYLAREEEKHEKMLRKAYQEALDLGDISPGVEEVGASSPHIFDRDKIKVESGSLEVSVYKVGILMEKASLDFYREAMEKTGDSGARALYQRLVDWEVEHLDMLEEMYRQAREEWWDRQGFSPA